MKEIRKMSLKRLSIKINQDFAFSKFMMRGKKSKSIFFPGCSFMKLGNDIIYKTLDILRLEDESIEVCSLCCAYPSQVLDKKYYKKNREKLVRFFKDRDVKKIYVACPNCYNMLKKLKNEYNLNFLVIMIYKILNEKLSNIDRYYPINDEVVIHDPCVIRKDIETQNTVREILEKIGQKYVEPLSTKDKTVCCGNIKMTHVLKPEVANKICKSRVHKLNEKSNIIMSYCNGCLYAFKKCNAKTIHLIELIFGKQDRDTFYNRIKFTIGLRRY